MRRVRSVALPRALFVPRRALSAAAREPATEAPIPSFSGNTKLFINNKFVNAVSGKTFPTFNPANGSVLAQVAEADAADVDIAAKAARRAFDEGPWTQKMAPRERGACLYRLADLVEKHKAELAQLETLNNGKALSLSQAVDVNATVAILRYYAGWADKINGKTVPIGPDFFNFTRHEPVGVVGAIIPWNLPLIGVAAKLGPALTTGNVIVLKSAEQTPLTAIRFAELVAEAGFPEGVVNIISGYGPTAGGAMTTHPLIDKIAFTGSVEVGKRIQAAAAGTIKRVTLELGGKNPSIVFADADMDLAIDNVHNGLFWNKGEACAAGTRIFVEEKIYDEFVERATKKALAWRVGNPFDTKTDQGAQVSEEQFNKVMSYIASGKQEGARLRAGGNRVGSKGYYVEPTVFSHVTDSMKIFREEIFGPVMTIAKFSSVDEVVKRANDSKYGLAAGVFTKDIVKGHMVASKLRAGLVFWNCYHVVDVSAPFGGMKESGFGREGGEYGLLPYLEVKNVVLRVTN